MVKVEVLYKDNQIDSLTAIGHAEYDRNGHDIVCSAISAVLGGGFNALREKHDIKLEPGNSYFKREGNLSLHDQIVLETILIQLLSIEGSYQENIKIFIRGEKL